MADNEVKNQGQQADIQPAPQADNLAQVMSPSPQSGFSFKFLAEDRLKQDGSNYTVWIAYVALIMQEAGVSEIVNVGFQGDDAGMLRADAMAKRLLLQAICQDLRSYVVSAKKSKEMMDLLKGMFEASSMEDALRVSRELKDAVLTKYSSMRAYLNELKTLESKLATTEFKVSEKQVIFHAMDGLPQEYSTSVRI